MAPNPYQVGTPRCGCPDCMADFPPERYGTRPERNGCLGPWRARYRSSDGCQRLKTLNTSTEARQFLATLHLEGADHGA